MERYDVVIVGTGAGGGTLARHLAPSGKKILLLERGDWLTREPENWDAAAVFVDNRYVSPDTWYDEKGKAFQPQVHYFVGGATKLYGAALYRLRPEDFGELRHHDGISPAWPITYDELEPYYLKAEQAYEVHGNRGEDPTEGPSSGPYPHPAVSHEPRIQQLSDALESHGYHPFHAPCGIRLDEAKPAFSACVRCANCDGFPCLVHGKSDADVLGVRPALEHPNVTLLTNAQVVKLVTDEAGTAVTEVVVDRDGVEERYAGDVVVLACGAANTAKVLLPSASDRHPNGLANGSDQVGRNYMFHDEPGRARAVARGEPDDVPEDPRAQRLLLRRATARSSRSGTSRWSASRRRRCSRARSRSRRSSRRAGRSSASRSTRSTSGSRPRTCRCAENRVTVDRDGRLTLAYKATNDVPKDEAVREAEVAARHARPEPGPPDLALRVPEERHPGRGLRAPGGHGALRRRPGLSALNRDCRAHEVDNLYVVDTSIFPSIGAVNPALTAMANSIRVGDHLLARMA